MDEVRSRILREGERTLEAGVLPLDRAEKERTRWWWGELWGVERLSLIQVSAGSWNGSMSSLPANMTLSAASREEVEEEEEEGWVCDCGGRE